MAALLVAGCGAEQSAPAGGGDAERPAITDEVREEARLVYDQRCAVCHGSTGAGDGPGGLALQPPPTDFRDAAWQASVTDEGIEQATVLGGAGVGKSPVMPANPDLRGKDALLRALAEHIRGLEQ